MKVMGNGCQNIDLKFFPVLFPVQRVCNSPKNRESGAKQKFFRYSFMDEVEPILFAIPVEN